MLSNVIARQTRQLCKTTTARPRLGQLTMDCSKALRDVKITPNSRNQIAAIDDQYRCAIYEETMDAYQAVSDITMPDNSPQAKLLAQAWQLIEGLSSMDQFFNHYDISIPSVTLEVAIHPSHRESLIRDFRTSWTSMKPEDRVALIEVINEKTFDQLGITLNASEKQYAKEKRQYIAPQLTLAHCLALLDYANSDSGGFNATNNSARLWHYYGVDTLARMTAALYNPFCEALRILEHYPAFVYEGPAYKGLSVANPAGNFRMSCMQAGMPLHCVHGISASSQREKNYASSSNIWSTRDMQLTFIYSRGIKIHLFNDETSRDQMEIIIPEGRQLKFLSPQEIDRTQFKDNGGPWPTYYCTEMAPDLPEKIQDGYLRC
ncbi:MAG: hypothetical protein LW731_05270 [Oxalobacteraceae bacterium]|nr:hypothetical protein [Oxalobacteraceae bacterium]